jgi:hypothetical protein
MPGALAFGAVVGWLVAMAGPPRQTGSLAKILRWLAFVTVFETGALALAWRAFAAHGAQAELAGAGAGILSALIMRDYIRKKII